MAWWNQKHIAVSWLEYNIHQIKMYKRVSDLVYTRIHEYKVRGKHSRIKHVENAKLQLVSCDEHWITKRYKRHHTAIY